MTVATRPALVLQGLDALLPQAPPAEAPELDTVQAARSRDLQSMEDHLLEQSSDLIRGSMHAMDLGLDPDLWPTTPPQAWVDEVGEERAKRLFNSAKAALLSKKNAPVALDMARSVHASITKARAQERGAPLVMNVAFITAQPVVYEEIEVGGEDG